MVALVRDHGISVLFVELFRTCASCTIQWILVFLLNALLLSPFLPALLRQPLFGDDADVIHLKAQGVVLAVCLGSVIQVLLLIGLCV